MQIPYLDILEWSKYILTQNNFIGLGLRRRFTEHAQYTCYLSQSQLEQRGRPMLREEVFKAVLGLE